MQAKEICKKHSVLLIADEVQNGCARTGKMLAGMYIHTRVCKIIISM